MNKKIEKNKILELGMPIMILSILVQTSGFLIIIFIGLEIVGIAIMMISTITFYIGLILWLIYLLKKLRKLTIAILLIISLIISLSCYFLWGGNPLTDILILPILIFAASLIKTWWQGKIKTENKL